jgi:hypothetical protein
VADFNIVSRFSKLWWCQPVRAFHLSGFLLKRTQVLNDMQMLAIVFLVKWCRNYEHWEFKSPISSQVPRFAAPIITKERIAGIFNWAF